ncbi:MAG: hypothetical protein ACYTKD_23325, partial [Planctomycetota bacterium]
MSSRRSAAALILAALVSTACGRRQIPGAVVGQQGASSTSAQGSVLKLNREFAPLVAESDLNKRYRYRLLCAVEKTRVHFLQAKPDGDSPDLVIVYDGDIRDSQAATENRDVFLERTGLRLFAFTPAGVKIDFDGSGLCAHQTSIIVLRKPGYTVLLLDQLFSGGGSGGHHERIARKYMVVAGGEARVARDHSVVTDFRIALQRYSLKWGMETADNTSRGAVRPAAFLEEPDMDISKLDELRPRLDDFLSRFDDCIKTLPSR